MVGFITIEILLGVIGAFSVPVCYLIFAFADSAGYQFFVLALVTVIGTLTGYEIPLLTRIIENEASLDENISDILTYDYMGALGATLLFPFVLLPFIGLYRSSLVFGLINILVASVTIHVFRDRLKLSKRYRFLINLIGVAVTAVILFMLVQTKEHINKWNEAIYKYPVIHSENSQYQTIDLTKIDSEFRMYLNGAIQFSSRDEYRYHEALVHVPLSQVDTPRSILVLGGGEGLAVREILKYSTVEHVDVVDIDPAITALSKENVLISRLNKGALEDPRVNILNEDAFKFLSTARGSYDAIIVDLPDPSNESLARLYSVSFYRLCHKNLSSNGVLVTQATSPNLSKKAFWCINETIREAGYGFTFPYQVHIPSFGNWGFVLAKNSPRFSLELNDDIEYKYLEDEIFEHLFYFAKDIRKEDVDINYIDQPILLNYYLDHWQSLQGQKR